MRIVTARARRRCPMSAAAAPARAARIEALGLIACSMVVLFGLWLTTRGRLTQLDTDDRERRDVDLPRLTSPAALVPLLTMFESPQERLVVAVPLFRRAVNDAPVLDHVGGLAEVTLPAADVKADRRLIKLRARLERRPDASAVAILSSADLAVLKPGVPCGPAPTTHRDRARRCGFSAPSGWRT